MKEHDGEHTTLQRLLRMWFDQFDLNKIESGCPDCSGNDHSCNTCRAIWIEKMMQKFGHVCVAELTCDAETNNKKITLGDRE